MNNRLKEALEYISKSVSISESIGTKQEKTLHQTIKYYLSLNEEELLVLICLINKGERSIYNPNIFIEELDMDKYQAMQVLNDLTEKNIIEIKLENNKVGKKEEYIYTTLLYKKIYNILLGENNQEKNTISTDIYLKFETEFGRTISPTEIEVINQWINSGISLDLIEEALKEAIINNVRNLKYIDRILYNWKQLGIKNKKERIQRSDLNLRLC